MKSSGLDKAAFTAHLKTLSVDELEHGTDDLIAYLRSLPAYDADHAFRQMVAETRTALDAMSAEEAHRVSQDLLKQAREQKAKQDWWDAYCQSREMIIDRVLMRNEHFDSALKLAREQAQSERDFGIYQPEAWERLTNLGLL